jgi:hypothetical protein
MLRNLLGTLSRTVEEEARSIARRANIDLAVVRFPALVGRNLTVAESAPETARHDDIVRRPGPPKAFHSLAAFLNVVHVPPSASTSLAASPANLVAEGLHLGPNAFVLFKHLVLRLLGLPDGRGTDITIRACDVLRRQQVLFFVKHAARYNG